VLSRIVVVAALALSASAQAIELSLAACAPPAYPPEALRYEIEGTVRLEFTAGADGRADQPQVVQSTGSGVLDRASLALLASCKFSPAEAAPGTAASLVVPWKLPGGTLPDLAPAMIPDSCRRGYKVLKFVRADSPERNLSVRVQVWPDGQPFTPRIEQMSGEPMADKEALEIVESCSFRPGTRAGQAVRSAALLTLALDRAAIAEGKVRALYDRLAAAMAKEKDFKARHILVTTESVALGIMADLKNGAQFGAIARKQSIDKPSGKVDGELGWLRPTDTVPEFSKALAAHHKPGLLPAPVRSQFGWHVIEIEASRPSEVPPYDDEVRRILKQKLIGAREVIVQLPPQGSRK
jgi:peptidyl-prolyl cis-trans isomerase C